jgi:hypothetical protein
MTVERKSRIYIFNKSMFIRITFVLSGISERNLRSGVRSISIHESS